MWYTYSMEHKSLKETNPFLKNSKLYTSMLIANVTSSATVELGKLHPAILKALQNNRYPTLIYRLTNDQESSSKSPQ